MANAGYATAPAAQGRGVGTGAARAFARRGAGDGSFLAMQFNFVVSTNLRAIATWEAGGIWPWSAAFREHSGHPRDGYVDALVMHRWL